MGGSDTGVRLAGLALAWLAGVAIHLQQRTLWPVPIQALLLVGGLACLFAAWRWRRVFVLALVGAALCGAGASGWRAALRMDDRLAPALEGRDLVVVGTVASLPQQGASGLRFRFAIESALLGGAPVVVPPRIALGWYKGFHEDATLSEPQRALRAGQRWRFAVRLRQPHGNLNPHGFDHELNLLEQGVRATGYVRGAPADLLDPEAGFVVERARQRVRDAIEASVADRRAAGVLAALAVGDQGAIEREDWDLFRNTGVAHLMSISGLHVTMFAWLAGLGVALLWRLSPRAMLRMPVPLAARLGGLAAALGYAIFSGWGVPAQRTVWMLATVVLLQASGLRWPWLLVLLLAAAVVTALDPWALMQPGFWLSFMAVGLLMASSPIDGSAGAPDAATDEPAADRGPVRRFADLLRGALRTQVIATLGLAPLTLVFFQQVSLVGFVANLFAIPLVTLVITPLALLGTLLAPLWSAGAWVVQGLAAALQSLEAVPGAVWSVAVAPVWAQLAGLLGAVLLVLPLPWRVRALAPLLVLPLLMPSRNLPAEGQFDLIALDVGQGTAIIVRTHDHVLVYDAGPQYARDSDAGQRVLLPYLRATGTARIDRLVLSHRDSDHTGGARALLTALPVGDLMSSLETAHPLLGLGSASTRCVAGQGWTWDGVRFDVLHPPADAYERGLKPNALSCVVRIGTPGRSALLAGDIERDQEAALVAGQAAMLRSDVLIAPHHGSRTSSTAAFIDAAQPATAVFQAGYRSRFGHPAPDVVARYRERGIAVVASPACGAWRWPHEGSRTEMHSGTCERQVARRYWHHAADPDDGLAGALGNGLSKDP
ncbi:MAG: DNA internalization-related competence protein ComEC/Rec2 [Caldimonas sp.]